MQALIYLGIMLAVIIVWFLVFKRPVYEAVLISLIVLLTVTTIRFSVTGEGTNTWAKIGEYVNKGLSTSLLY